MATNCAAEAGEGAGAAFLRSDEVSPDWLLTCSNRPESRSGKFLSPMNRM